MLRKRGYRAIRAAQGRERDAAWSQEASIVLEYQSTYPDQALARGGVDVPPWSAPPPPKRRGGPLIGPVRPEPNVGPKHGARAEGKVVLSRGQGRASQADPLGRLVHLHSPSALGKRAHTREEDRAPRAPSHVWSGGTGLSALRSRAQRRASHSLPQEEKRGVRWTGFACHCAVKASTVRRRPSSFGQRVRKGERKEVD